MPIFRRDPPAAPQATPRPARRTAEEVAGREAETQRRGGPTVIAAGTRVTGEITGSADLRIEGELDGTVTLDSEVIIASGGRAQGRIHARRVRIGGRVQGDVEGIELVEITPSGTLEGDIRAARVLIAEGAFFKGQVEMPGKGDVAAPPRRQPASPPAASPAASSPPAAKSPLFPEPGPQGG